MTGVQTCALPIYIIDFISGISPNEERLRWFRLQAMHYALLMFINTFGYDFQYTGSSRITELKKMHKDNPTIKNLEKILSKIKLQENKERRARLQHKIQESQDQPTMKEMH